MPYIFLECKILKRLILREHGIPASFKCRACQRSFLVLPQQPLQRIMPVNAAQDMEQRAFTRPVQSHQPYDLIGANLQIKIREDGVCFRTVPSS